MKYLVGKPKIVNEPLFKRRIEDILFNCQYSNNGTYVQQLEDKFKELYEVKYVIAVNNATSALECCLAYLASQTTLSQVLVPSFTFVATVAAVIRAGFTPVFVDILNDFTFDLDDLDKKINKRTAGILPCNLFGNLSAVDIIPKYTGLFTMYDSAHGLGIADEMSTKYVGSFGDCEVISLHPTKFGGAMEGGLITTSNKDIADFAIRYRNFGFNPDAGPQGEVVGLGTNCKMNEISAAAALCQLECIEEIHSHYYSIYKTYEENLPDSVTLCKPNVYFSNFGYVVVRSKERDKLLQHLYDNDIFARTYFKPVHKIPFYTKYVKGKLPMTEYISSEVLALPTGLHVVEEDVVNICNVISTVKSKGK